MHIQDQCLIGIAAVTLIYGVKVTWYMGAHKGLDAKMRTQSVISFVLFIFTLGVLATCCVRWVFT